MQKKRRRLYRFTKAVPLTGERAGAGRRAHAASGPPRNPPSPRARVWMYTLSSVACDRSIAHAYRLHSVQRDRLAPVPCQPLCALDAGATVYCKAVYRVLIRRFVLRLLTRLFEGHMLPNSVSVTRGKHYAQRMWFS